MVYFYAVLIGVSISLMIGINGMLSRFLPIYFSTALIHFIGLVVLLILFLIKKVRINFSRSIPLYLYLGGAIGVLTVVFNITSFTAIGASLTLALGLLGESITSTIIDHFGLFGAKAIAFQPKKLVGMSIILVGIIMMATF